MNVLVFSINPHMTNVLELTLVPANVVTHPEPYGVGGRAINVNNK